MAMWMRVTWPNGAKSSRRSLSVVWKFMLPTNKLFILTLPVLFEAPRVQDLGKLPLPGHYETLT
jgi:hypothetical protein